MPQLEPMPLTRRLAREALWALGCVLVVGTLFVTVFSNMEGGPHDGALAISPSAWAVLWDEWLGGHFLMVPGWSVRSMGFSGTTATASSVE